MGDGEGEVGARVFVVAAVGVEVTVGGTAVGVGGGVTVSGTVAAAAAAVGVAIGAAVGWRQAASQAPNVLNTKPTKVRRETDGSRPDFSSTDGSITTCLVVCNWTRIS